MAMEMVMMNVTEEGRLEMTGCTPGCAFRGGAGRQETSDGRCPRVGRMRGFTSLLVTGVQPVPPRGGRNIKRASFSEERGK